MAAIGNAVISTRPPGDGRRPWTVGLHGIAQIEPANAVASLAVRDHLRRSWQHYGLAVVSVLVALGSGLLMERLHLRVAPTTLFLLAIAITSWYAGARAATFAVLLSAPPFDYFFVGPRYSLAIHISELPYFLLFLTLAALITWFSTVRHRVERDLVQSRDELAREVARRSQQASLLDLTHDIIFVRDMDDVITYWNRGAEELFGWTPEQAIGRHAHELLKSAFPVSLEAARAELLNHDRWQGEIRKTCADGTAVVISSRWSVQRDELGQPVAILATGNDITGSKRRDEEVRDLNSQLAKRTVDLEASNKELEAFAYSVSHDLRAPLRHIAGFTELLQRHSAATLDDKSQRYLTMILDSGKRMGTLIDDLLAFSQMGRADAHDTTFSLQQVVQEAIAEVQPETKGRTIAWRVGPLPTVYGDRAMMRLAFANLISNAVKFTRTRQNAEIEIQAADQTNGQLVVSVRDNGVGFDMRYVNKLFGVFQRLHAADAFEGTGIGLATVQRIVHRHGGRVWASAEVDQGATFYVALPKMGDTA